MSIKVTKNAIIIVTNSSQEFAPHHGVENVGIVMERRNESPSSITLLCDCITGSGRNVDALNNLKIVHISHLISSHLI